MIHIQYRDFDAALKLIINFCRSRKLTLNTFVRYFKIEMTPVENYSPFFSPSEGTDDRSSSDSIIISQFGEYIKLSIVRRQDNEDDEPIESVFFKTLYLIREIQDHLPGCNIEDII